LFDKDGNVTGTLDPRNQLTQFVFDNAGGEIRTTDPNGNKARRFTIKSATSASQSHPHSMVHDVSRPEYRGWGI
jgi:YD repeat-containing protein